MRLRYAFLPLILAVAANAQGWINLRPGPVIKGSIVVVQWNAGPAPVQVLEIEVVLEGGGSTREERGPYFDLTGETVWEDVFVPTNAKALYLEVVGQPETQVCRPAIPRTWKGPV